MADVWTPLANMLGNLILKYADQVLEQIENDSIQPDGVQQQNVNIQDHPLDKDSAA